MSLSLAKENFVTRTLVPLLLVTLCPPFAMLLWYTNAHLDGSLMLLGQTILSDGLWQVLHDAWLVRFWGSPTAWAMIGVMAVLQLAMMKLLPGKPFTGTITPMGNLPEYRDNGLASYLITFALFLGASVGLGWFSPGIVYHEFGELLAALNISALVFCLVLYLKGRFAPSTTDSGHSGNFIFDYYWGTELYPRIAGWDVKMFTNCRFGMTGWAIAVTSYAFAQYEIHGSADWSILVSAALIVIYLGKFFVWEAGYMRSMDIIVDRAGFYICWGCLVWVPAVYTLPVQFMVGHPVGLSFGWAAVIFVLGLAAIGINYWADRQRQQVRATDGDKLIWGKKPKLIRAEYVTDTGERKENLLLASGFWGISRHFHYVPELGAAFLWSCATGFTHLMPFFYVIFLSILLFHRAFRDDGKCRKKYGKYWEEYCKAVPYKVIPGVV